MLLILAGVTIATLVGDNGILNQAQKAKEETEIVTREEQRKMAMYEATMNTENTKYIDLKTKKEVLVPSGFAVSQVEGENTIEDGLVIIDSSGNEFVWIPVNKENFDTEFIRYEGYAAGRLQNFLNKTEEADKNGNNKIVQESETTKKEAIDMYESIENYEGFYIGRYETGKDNDGNVVIQRNVSVYNKVKWGNDNSDDSGGAVEKARDFKNGKAYCNSVVSTLIYGVEWDATMNFIDSNYKTNNCNADSYVVNGKGKGWYYDNSNYQPQKTGTNLFDNNGNIVNKMKNIYDLGGNVFERTMEISSETLNRIVRRWLLWE